jgi:hypothetical protein
MERQLKRIRDLSEARRLPAQVFERLIHEALDEVMPFCVLPNVVLFRPDQFQTDASDSYAKAYEIDNLFHYREREVDYIVIVETKSQPIRIENGKWIVQYAKEGTDELRYKDVRGQLLNHAKTIRRYLRPMGRNVELKIKALLVSSDPNTKQILPTDDQPVWMGMCGYNYLPHWVEQLRRGRDGGLKPDILRVAQSEFMALLRLGIPVRSLGHPELRNAIHYINRCKREIDSELFRTYEPSKRRWAINGSAGMGKSVLLAYATAVFASDRVLVADDEVIKLALNEGRNQEMGLAEVRSRNICVFAMKPKQRQVLELLYAQFVRDLSAAAPNEELNFLKPRFDVWNDTVGVPKGCNVLVVDESHDLTTTGQEKIRRWHEESEGNYLMLACDRHQKIRLGGSNATLINGLTFSGFTKRLSRNYRNPFPIYTASLALMFRWFGGSGPKVIPSNTELRDWLGFDIDATTLGNQVVLRLQNDSHPANAWSHCVGTFINCAAAFGHLSQQNLATSEVLWVRFSKEDPEFDYERLSCFTYHNFHTSESSDLVDKYVKGQEFPIVVIEGFPDQMDDFGEWQSNPDQMDEKERAMWMFRRELYLCASRATGFLYFICNVTETEAVTRIEAELLDLLSQLSAPSKADAAQGNVWRFTLKKSDQIRKVDEFSDAVERAPIVSPDDQPRKVDEISATIKRAPIATQLAIPLPRPVIAKPDVEAAPPVAPPAIILSPSVPIIPTPMAPVLPRATQLPLKISLKHPVSMAEFAQAIGLTPAQVSEELARDKVYLNRNMTIPGRIAHELARRHGIELDIVL